MANPYAVDKILRYPAYVDSFLKHYSHNMNPISIHLMPCNRCNQNCSFCSYRIDGGKNAQKFDPKVEIPWPKMNELIDDMYLMGVQGVEITGGGEPLLYTHIDKMLERLAATDLDTALVTNGTLLTPELADALYKTKLKWARVSIDAGDPQTYSLTRRASGSHWDRAWNAVKLLVERRQDQVIGLGFVVSPMNYASLESFLCRAAISGADNVRVSVAFTPAGRNILTPDQIEHCLRSLSRAKYLVSDSFKIIDLFEERLNNLAGGRQDYEYCGTKDILCVIEGSQSVYTCCSLTGDPRGLLGSIEDKRFCHLWWGSSNYRKKFDPRKMCNCECLYEKRNQIMLGLRGACPHRSFV